MANALNRNLVFFAAFLILIGVGSGVYLISFLGVLLLIPALLSPSRLPAPRVPTSGQTQPPRRIIPPAPAKHPQSPQETQPMAAQMEAPMQYQGYAGPLFPAPMFPSLSQMGAPPSATSRPPPPVTQGRDELLEVGAILAALKLLSG